ncbi:MAG: hypothetical protein EDM79_11530 [Chloroflexi bacterium]|nr:MAG: hypothetical protein EDM79_11530 [Chloroflexota bacterium]
MKKIHFRFRYLFVVAAAAVFLFASCGAPPATEAPATEAPPDTSTQQVAVPATATSESAFPTSTPSSQVATPSVGGEPAPALPEFRRLTLEYPSSIKAGAESDVVRLTLEVDTLGNITPTAEVGGNVVEGEVIEIPNLYATHNVTAEAYYEVVGLEVKPTGSTFQPLKQGQSVTFYWSVGTQNVGKYRGTIWLHLNFENRSTGEKSRIPVNAQIVEIEAVDFFGFSTNFVRTSGVVGSVVGSIVGFPFLKDIIKYLYGKLLKPKRKPSKPAAKSKKKT